MFVVYGYQGAEEDAEKLRLTDRLLQAVLAEGSGCFVLVSLCLLLGILMLILQSFPVWLRVYLLVGLLIWLMRILLVLVLCLVILVLSIGMMVLVLVEISLLAVLMLLLASQVCCVTDRWFAPHFSLLASFRIDAWMADVACPVTSQPPLACLLVGHS